MQIVLIVALIISIAVAVFAIQNSVPVVVSFLAWEARTSLVILILGSALAGAVVSALLASVRWVRLSKELRASRRRIREMEAQTPNEPLPSPPSGPGHP
ncbi:MAG: LapA family protein [Nitrospirae bacterium]|nr:LapA family protein [Nitrospirota bacterium]